MVPQIINLERRNEMKVKAVTAVLGLAVILGALAPVSAQETPSTTPEPKSQSDDGGLSSLPGKALGAAFGALFGTPIAIVRKTAEETVSATKDLVGESENPFLIGAAGILGVPAGICSGVLQGPFVATKNGWDNKPFSKESFSLGEK